MKTSEVPVLIVGGGSAGTMLSLELARHGIEFRTVDRLQSPVTTSKAIALHARTAEMIERVDRRLIQRFLDRAIENKGYVLHFVDGNGKRSEVRPGLDFTTLDCRYPCILVHGQSDTEKYIREYLGEEFNKGIEWGTQCVEVEQSGDEVMALLERDGVREQVRCRYLVACDGINSRVRRSLSLSQQESDYAGTVLQNMDVFLKNFPDAEDYIHYCAGTDHFIMIVKLPGGFYRLLLSDRGEAADPNVPPEVAFMNLIDRHFDGVSLGEQVWHTKWESWVRLADTYREGNVFLAGDSAHVHSTTGGQGMNCCMQDAYNLGWKLGFVLNGLAGAELLDTYEAERRPIAEQVIWAASSLHEIFMGHGKDIAERAEKITDAAFLDKVVGACSGIAYTYRDYVAQPDDAAPVPGPKVGDRLADFDLPGGGTLFDLTRHTKFTLLALGPSDDESLSVARQIAERYASPLEFHSVAGAEPLEKQFGALSELRLVLVRPDGYIGHHCRGSDGNALRQFLGSLLTG